MNQTIPLSLKANMGNVDHVSFHTLDKTLVLAATSSGSLDRISWRMGFGRLDIQSIASTTLYYLKETIIAETCDPVTMLKRL